MKHRTKRRPALFLWFTGVVIGLYAIGSSTPTRYKKAVSPKLITLVTPAPVAASRPAPVAPAYDPISAAADKLALHRMAHPDTVPSASENSVFQQPQPGQDYSLDASQDYYAQQAVLAQQERDDAAAREYAAQVETYQAAESEYRQNNTIDSGSVALGGSGHFSYDAPQVHVNGYYRRNGTYVHSYTRNAPGYGRSRR